MADQILCSVLDCDKPSDRLGYCTAHYMRQRRNNGDPLAGRVPPGAREAFVLQAASSNVDCCIIWPFPVNKRTGYGTARVKGKTTTAHRAVLSIYSGLFPSREIQAAHAPEICHNRLCVNPRHLRWATRTENEADKGPDGTRMEGPGHPRALFTAEQVRSIRADPRAASVIGRDLGVGRYLIHNIKKRFTYSSVV